MGKPCVIGNMNLLSINEIERIPLQGVFQCKDREPPDASNCAAFEFDMMTDLHVARIALIYRNTVDIDVNGGHAMEVTSDGLSIKPKCGSYEEPEIWIQDASCNWYFITDCFTKYLRLAVVHLGIIGWQNTYTLAGLQPVTKQWMSLFCKERLTLDLHQLHVKNMNVGQKDKDKNHNDLFT